MEQVIRQDVEYGVLGQARERARCQSKGRYMRIQWSIRQENKPTGFVSNNRKYRNIEYLFNL